MTIHPSHRLPIQHPDYRYTESRNPYWLKLQEFKGRVFHDNETETHRGHWRERFLDATSRPGARELHVELGCSAGHVVTEWARRHPENAYIGVDWKYKMIHKAAEKAVKGKLENLLLFRAHNERVAFMFGPGEVDRLYLFFPDPWPRKSQWKNRFLTERSLRAIAPILRQETGIFHIKTDHPGYFEWMEEAVKKASDLWEVVERTADLHAGHPAPETLTFPEVTLFERLFIKDQIPIQSLKLRLKALSSRP